MYAVVVETPIKNASKSVYVWGAPSTMRRMMTIVPYYAFRKYMAEHGAKLEGVIVTGKKSLETLEGYGVHVRNAGVAYGILHGCADRLKLKTNVGARYVICVCAPSIDEMNAGGRTARFMYMRWLQKISEPQRFVKPAILSWSDAADSGGGVLEECLNSPDLRFISIDLETTKEIETRNPNTGEYVKVRGVIDLAGYCFAFHDPEAGWYYRTVVHDMTSMINLEWLRYVCNSDTPKTLQNGCYDLAYLTRWQVPLRNYVHDTMYWMKSVTPFLSGYYNLSSIATFYLLTSAYWKDGRKAQTRYEYKEYCARDCLMTAQIAVGQLSLTSKYTFNNFSSRFYTVPVTLTAEMRGALLDEQVYEKTVREYELKSVVAAENVRKWTGVGPNQSARLLPIFKGFELLARKLKMPDVQTITSTDTKNRANLVLFHPLASKLAEEIANARRYEKWLSTYLKVELWSSENNAGYGREGRVYLFRLDPFGTESGRLSSSSSSFWAGGPGQNIPNELRKIFKAPEGFVYAGTDAPQSETRTTAYCSRESRLRDVVEGIHDFHSFNASAFFGIPYNEIYDDASGKKLNKELRDLAKRVNHGANYNMGAFVLLTTIGVTNVRRAQRLLNLDSSWSLIQVCAYLLQSFDRTYPGIRGRWYFEQIQKVLKTGRLGCVSGYAPLVLTSPLDSKMNLNSIVSLDPQNWSVYISLAAANNLLSAELGGSGIKYLHQMHDENLTLVPTSAGHTVKDIDDYFRRHCANEQTMSWTWHDGSQAKLVIPVGETVFGTHWSDMKEDPVVRTDDYLEKSVSSIGV